MLVLPLRDEAVLRPQGGAGAAGLVPPFVLSKCLGVDYWLLFGRCATGTAGAASAGCPLLCRRVGSFVALAVADVACPARTGWRRNRDG